MPELLSKHPDVVLQVLKSQGAQCGTGVKPKILTRCPTEKFCTLQGGELCVYGVGEIGQMTQLSRAEVCGGPPSPRASMSDVISHPLTALAQAIGLAGGHASPGVGLVLAPVCAAAFFAIVRARSRRRRYLRTDRSGA